MRFMWNMLKLRWSKSKHTAYMLFQNTHRYTWSCWEAWHVIQLRNVRPRAGRRGSGGGHYWRQLLALQQQEQLPLGRPWGRPHRLTRYGTVTLWHQCLRFRYASSSCSCIRDSCKDSIGYLYFDPDFRNFCASVFVHGAACTWRHEFVNTYCRSSSVATRSVCKFLVERIKWSLCFSCPRYFKFSIHLCVPLLLPLPTLRHTEL